MPNNFAIRAILGLALGSMANAHMKMAFPVPFDVANLDTSPLQASGSDYPCKKSSYKITAMNKIPVNEAVLLDFNGTAIHEGGTCELSISLDKEPTADSVFKVIQVFEGGCPTVQGTGGLTFNIPKEFPSTERATLAWTWFNRIGNREMYMNCAPIEVTGGSDNKDYYDSLPDMFRANIGNGCATVENGDPIIPNPGQFYIKSDTAKPLAVAGSCGAGSQNKQQAQSSPNLAAYSPPAKDSNEIEYVDGGSGAGGAASIAAGGGGNNGMYTQPAASPAQPSSTPVVGGGGSGGVYSQPATSLAPSTSIATSSAAPSASTPASTAVVLPTSSFETMTVPASSATAAAPPYPTLSPSLGQGVSGPSSGSAAIPSGSPASSGSSSSGSANTSGHCTTDGAVVCNGPTQFGLCNNGSVVWQAVAAGTTCSNAVIQKRSAHVRRHAHGAYKVRAS